MQLLSTKYAGLGPTQAAEKLANKHGLSISRETLRKWMRDAGISSSRKQRQTHDQHQNPREHYGEQINIYGFQHNWCKARKPPCQLLVFMDDATSKLMHMEFVTSADIFCYFRALRNYMQAHGRPVAFCGHRRALLRASLQSARSSMGTTQLSRALHELDIGLIFAKAGVTAHHVERTANLLARKVFDEIQLTGVSDLVTGNAFLLDFTQRYDDRFAPEPSQPKNFHRALNMEPHCLTDILCVQNKRYVNAKLAFSYDRYRIILDDRHFSSKLSGEYIDTYEYDDGSLDFRWKGTSLPYRKFDLVQKVTEASFKKNVHLSSVLEHIKALQDKTPPKRTRS